MSQRSFLEPAAVLEELEPGTGTHFITFPNWLPALLAGRGRPCLKLLMLKVLVIG
jgi:hypothetical protein